MLFTPFDKKHITGLPLDSMGRVHLNVSAADNAKAKRNCRWTATIFDKKSKRYFVVRDASCGIPNCHCAAAIVKEAE